MGSRIEKALMVSVLALAAQSIAAVPQPGPEAVSAYAAAIPDRPYYPPGYRNLRIAAAAQVATFPRDPASVIYNGWHGSPIYDLIDCSEDNAGSNETDPHILEQGNVALEIARIGGELRGLGYRGEIFEEPLLAYEREALAAVPAAVAERREIAAANAAQAEMEQSEAVQSEAEVAGPEAAPAMSEAERTEADAEMTEAKIAARYGPIGMLALEMEKRRARLQPDKPRIAVEGGCGAAELAFQIRAAPSDGKVWLIPAFSFHVCMTKVRDPWDLRACRWNEVDPDNATMASGRYMYQARWPDGKTARGARVFEGDFDSEAPTRITIRKN